MPPIRRAVTVRAPLLDRLVDTEPRQPTEPRPFRTLDADGVRESIGRELRRLLNTRVSHSARAVEAAERTTINYGIPDLSAFYGLKATDQARLLRLLERTISVYEPRLVNVRVAIAPRGAAERSLVVRVEGALAIDPVKEAVAFPVTIEPGPAR